MFVVSILFMLFCSKYEPTDAFLVDPETYVLHPRDRLQLVVSGIEGFIQDLVVNSDGTMIVAIGGQPTIPEPTTSTPGETSVITADFTQGIPLGVVYAEGKTLRQVEAEVAGIVRKYYHNVGVNLVMVRPRHFVISLVGEVTASAPVEVTNFWRISEVIGQFYLTEIELTPSASLRRIMLIHPGGEVDTADYVKFLETGDYKYDPFFQGEGDVLLFPPMEKTVVIRGAVEGLRTQNVNVSYDSSTYLTSKECVYEILPGETLKDIIEQAGGFLPWANRRNIQLIRDGRVIPINYYDTLMVSELVLNNEDTIVVPEVRNNVMVTGAVEQPGSFIYQPMMTAYDYVNRAGGITERGMANKLIVYSAEGTVRGRGLNVIVERGDIVEVPSMTLRWWQDYVTIIGAVSSLTAIIIALTR